MDLKCKVLGNRESFTDQLLSEIEKVKRMGKRDFKLIFGKKRKWKKKSVYKNGKKVDVFDSDMKTKRRNRRPKKLGNGIKKHLLKDGREVTSREIFERKNGIPLPPIDFTGKEVKC